MPVDERRVINDCEYVFELCTELIVGYNGSASVIMQKYLFMFVSKDVLMEASDVNYLQMKVVS